MVELDNKLEDLEDEEEEAVTAQGTPKLSDGEEHSSSEDPALDASFMSESIYQKLPSPRTRRHKSYRKSTQRHTRYHTC